MDQERDQRLRQTMHSAKLDGVVAWRVRAKALTEELTTAQAIQAYISDPMQVKHLFDVVGSVDVLVNNAGHETATAAIDLPIVEWDSIMNVNLRGAFLCSQAAARLMRDQHTGGVIINNSSMHDQTPLGLALLEELFNDNRPIPVAFQPNWKTRLRCVGL